VDLLLMKPDVVVLPTLVPKGFIHRVSAFSSGSRR
jgi:hypothetical protein